MSIRSLAISVVAADQFEIVPPFPTDLVDNENPNIYVTSPTSTRFPPPLSISNLTAASMNVGNTPSSSPTATEFSLHSQHSHSHSQHPQHPQHSHYGHHPHHHNHSHNHNQSHSHGQLSRQQSIQHISFSRNGTSGTGSAGTDNLSAS